MTHSRPGMAADEQVFAVATYQHDPHAINFLVSNEIVANWKGDLSEWSAPVQLRFVRQGNGLYDLIVRNVRPEWDA